MAPSFPPDPGTWDLQQVLNEEMAHLPEKYRAPIVLCCLEEKSKEEAARLLGLPPGTVSSRLARARKRLQKRLVMRGVTLSAALAAGMTATTEVPAALVNVTARAAWLAATRGVAHAGVSETIAAIVGELTRALSSAKWKLTILSVFVVAISATAAATCHVLASRAPIGEAAVTGSVQASEIVGPALDAHGDVLPVGARFRLGTSRFQHGKPILAAALSGDGHSLVTASAKYLTIWDAATGQPRLRNIEVRLRDEFGPGRSPLAISPDGAQIACAQRDGRVNFWCLKTGKAESPLTVTVPSAESKSGKSAGSLARKTPSSGRSRAPKDLLFLAGPSGCPLP